MNGLIAVQKLEVMGYRFQVMGKLSAMYGMGSGKPDPSQVCPLLALVKDTQAGSAGLSEQADLTGASLDLP